MTLAASFSSFVRADRQPAFGLGLAGARLRLRPAGRDDAGRLDDADPALIESDWLKYGFGYLVVCHGADAVGHVRLQPVSDCTGRAAELSYAVALAHRAQGYATEAVGMVLQFAFEDAHLDYVVACVEPHNEAGMRVVENNGFAWISTGKRHGRTMRRYILPQAMWRAQRRALASLRTE